MIVTGISAEQFVAAINVTSARYYGGNIVPDVSSVMSPNRFRARVLVRESGARLYPKSQQSARGARRSWSGRRLSAACWHAYRDAIMAIFDVNPDARVYTSMAKYIGVQGFLDQYPLTAHHNIGSMAQPAYMPELCDCDTYGIDTREAG